MNNKNLLEKKIDDIINTGDLVMIKWLERQTAYLTPTQKKRVEAIIKHTSPNKTNHYKNWYTITLYFALLILACGLITITFGCEKVIERVEVSQQPCTTTPTASGYLLNCPNMSPVEILHGVDGEDGQDFDPVVIQNIFSYIDLLQTDINNLDVRITELEENMPENTCFVKLCASNEYAIKKGNIFYAVYHQELSSGKSNTYLSKLSEGLVYQTTDGLAKKFKIVNSNVECL